MPSRGAVVSPQPLPALNGEGENNGGFQRDRTGSRGHLNARNCLESAPGIASRSPVGSVLRRAVSGESSSVKIWCVSNPGSVRYIPAYA
jgi:hypothetical protein